MRCKFSVFASWITCFDEKVFINVSADNIVNLKGINVNFITTNIKSNFAF